MHGAVRAAGATLGLFGIAIVVQLVLGAILARDVPPLAVATVRMATPIVSPSRRLETATTPPVTATRTPTATPTPTATHSPTAVRPTPSSTLAPTATPTATPTPTAIATATVAPTATPMPTQPPVAAAPEPPATLAPRTHVVRPGDSVSNIAARYGISPQALVNANALKGPQWIVIGQVLSIP